MEMRRKDLAVTEPAQIDAIINHCDCFRLAFADGKHPYIVPLNFGFQHVDGVRKFYFHSAAAGRKVDLCRSLGYAGFEMDTNRAVNPNEKACDFSMSYQCVIGEGEIQELTSLEEKAEGLKVIMKQYTGRDDWAFPEHVLAKTCVFCLTVTEISGRQHG